MVHAVDMGDYYRVPADIRDLNYSKYFEEGEEVVTQAHEYHSHNTVQLSEVELTRLLLKLREIKSDIQEFA
jgi:UDP-glucose 4-epimerase